MARRHRRRRPRGVQASSRIVGFAITSALLVPAPAAAATILPLPAGHRSTEASVAVDPGNPHGVLVVARDEKRARRVGIRMWRSTNGGRSFRTRMLVDRRLDGAPAE